jgi:hypothetical protein
MDAKIIAAIIGLLGLFIGSLLNGIGFFLRERYQRIRVVNQSIFYLLKLFHINSALKNIDQMVSAYSKMLKEHPDTRELMAVDENTLNQYCNQFLASIINPIFQNVNEEFKQKFNESIFELSNVKPVVAYELSKTSYNEALSQEAMRILQNPNYTKNQSQEYKEGFENGVKASQKHIFQEFEAILIKGIKNLSWSTNFLNSIACRYKILMIKQKFSEEKIKSYLEDYFEKTIIPLMEPYKNKNSR